MSDHHSRANATGCLVSMIAIAVMASVWFAFVWALVRVIRWAWGE